MQKVWHLIKSKKIKFQDARKKVVGTHHLKGRHKDRPQQGGRDFED
jgi:hypothetical protein